ncbi:hypothetical protein BJ742DRAFT_738265 [Cladochytrium replicatum]|nr:hypothetical protein BJ742DRAFT_738265 [Cladochytrium replicatum]
MSFDRTPAQLASELAALSERNREITKEIQELKKERVFWRDTQHQVVQYETAVDSLKKEQQSLLSELVRLRRANDDLSRQLDRELEEHNETKQRLNDTEAALRRAVIDLKAKSKELEGRVSDFRRSRANSNDFYDDPESPGSVLEINPSPPPSPRDSYGISFTDNSYFNVRKQSSAFSLKDAREENEKLRQTIEDLQTALSSKDKQVKNMGREIIDYQRVLSTLMDDLERRDEQSMFGMEEENDGLGPLRTDDGFPVVQIISERGVRRIRSRLAFDDDEFGYADQQAPEPTNTLGRELAGFSGRAPSSASDDSGVVMNAEDEPPVLRHRSSSSSSSVSNNEVIGTSLADELEQLGQFDVLNGSQTSKDGQPAKLGEAGFLKARLEAVGLNTTGNRKVLKKRLQAYINRKKKQLATSADPEKKLAALQTIEAARHH